MPNTLSNLKELKKIKPDEAFRVNSLAAILKNSQMPTRQAFLAHIWESARYTLALSLGSTIILIALGGFSYSYFGDAAPVLMSSLNTKSLLFEARESSFEIKLAEAKYLDDISTAMANALNTITQNDLDHLNNEILKKEMRALDEPEKNNQLLDGILNKIL